MRCCNVLTRIVTYLKCFGIKVVVCLYFVVFFLKRAVVNEQSDFVGGTG